MAFALSIVVLEEALKKAGCPVCRMEHDAAIHSIDSFLWEFTNDPGARAPINDAYGFCLDHTQMLVSTDLSGSGSAVGVNFVYALLAKNISHDLQHLARSEKSRRSFQGFLKRLNLAQNRAANKPLLAPRGRCPICVQLDQSAHNILATLFELLAEQDKNITTLYHQSNGLCLRHLRSGLMDFMQTHPFAAELLIKDAIQRLDTQQAQMLEYIRKHDWAYRQEKITTEEQTAWKRTLTFFTGHPGGKFSNRKSEF